MPWSSRNCDESKNDNAFVPKSILNSTEHQEKPSRWMTLHSLSTPFLQRQLLVPFPANSGGVHTQNPRDCWPRAATSPPRYCSLPILSPLVQPHNLWQDALWFTLSPLPFLFAPAAQSSSSESATPRLWCSGWLSAASSISPTSILVKAILPARLNANLPKYLFHQHKSCRYQSEHNLNGRS